MLTAVWDGHQAIHIPPHNLLCLPTENLLGRRVHSFHDAPLIDGDDAFDSRPQNGVQAFFAVAQASRSIGMVRGLQLPNLPEQLLPAQMFILQPSEIGALSPKRLENPISIATVRVEERAQPPVIPVINGLIKGMRPCNTRKVMRTWSKLNRILIAGWMLVGLTATWAAEETSQRWSEEKAWSWHQKTGWLAGCDFLPSTAINQLEMFQADTFDLTTIDRELGWAQSLGFNSMRVYLQDLLWQQDSAGFLKRLDQFLAVADKHRIGVVFVLFDSCWDPFPRAR